ncbi:hypothetical protein IID10_05070 [candidate division KSB1 bacterium]|nr:hypothetical protein [candidate division KSB1 bacterium]
MCAPTTRSRSIRYAGITIGVPLIAFTVVTIHELTQIVNGRLADVPFDRFEIFNSTTLSPSVYWNVTTESSALTVTHWSGRLGGMAASGFLYIALKIRQAESLQRIALTSFLAALAAWQMSLDTLEGGLHDTYIAGSGGRDPIMVWKQMGALLSGAMLFPVWDGWSLFKSSLLAKYVRLLSEGLRNRTI